MAAGRGVIGGGSTTDSDLIDVELVRIRVPLLEGLASAHGREDVRDLVLVRVTLADGTEGWGECSALARPTYTGEHTAGAWAVLRDELVPARLAGRSSTVVGHPMAASALLSAEADAHLRRAGRSMASQLALLQGVESLSAVPVAAVVGRDGSVDDRIARVDRHLDDHVALIKMKVTPLQEDIATVATVRSLWPDLALAVDFNGSADLDSLRLLDELDLAYIEQPAPAEALVESAFFAGRTRTPIALDESVTGRGTLTSAVALGAGSVVNVKPARVGGPFVAAQLVADAKESGIDAFVGGMLETGVGRAMAAAVAALPGCAFPTDLGPSSRYFDRDLTEPITVDGRGHLVIPEGPGCGRSPDPDRLAAVAVDRLLLAR